MDAIQALTQALVVIGASVFLLLGALHGALTLRDMVGPPRCIGPRDAALHAAMQRATLAIHRDTNLWRAWIGFNLSHSLGAMMFGIAYAVIGGALLPVYASSPALQAVAVAVAAVYLLLSLNFWFIRPTVCVAFALACFAAAALLARA